MILTDVGGLAANSAFRPQAVTLVRRRVSHSEAAPLRNRHLTLTRNSRVSSAKTAVPVSQPPWQKRGPGRNGLCPSGGRGAGPGRGPVEPWGGARKRFHMARFAAGGSHGGPQVKSKMST